MRLCYLGFAVLMIATSCAPQDTFTKSDFSKQQFAADFNHCVMEGQTISNNSGMSNDFGGQMMGLALMKQARDRCMIGKGYTHMCGSVECTD
jgi:hypothetical protein